MAKPYIRNQTKFIGVYYINSITSNKPDKTFYIRYKDENSKDKELKIEYGSGLHSFHCTTIGCLFDKISIFCCTLPEALSVFYEIINQKRR